MPGSAAPPLIRAKTSWTTMAFASWLDSPGRLAKTAPCAARSPSANARCPNPARSTAAANDAGAVTTTSWPASRRARAKGVIGPKWPAPAVVATRTRTSASRLEPYLGGVGGGVLHPHHQLLAGRASPCADRRAGGAVALGERPPVCRLPGAGEDAV